MIGIANLDEITLRILPATGFITKGSEISFPEEDMNFIILANSIRQLNDALLSSLSPYDPAVEYSLGEYVSFEGNIYQFISNTPQTGVTPGTNITVWDLTSAGALSHVQNSDTYLAKGTAQELTLPTTGGVIATQGYVNELIDDIPSVDLTNYFNKAGNSFGSSAFMGLSDAYDLDIGRGGYSAIRLRAGGLRNDIQFYARDITFDSIGGLYAAFAQDVNLGSGTGFNTTITGGNFAIIQASSAIIQAYAGDVELNASGIIKASSLVNYTSDFSATIGSDDSNLAHVGYVNSKTTALKQGVPSAGDTLNKLYNLIVGIGQFAGDHDASGGTLPTAGTGEGGSIDKGDFWRVSVTGVISGLGTLRNGDVIYSKIANATVSADFFAVENNQDQATSTVLGLVKLYTDALSSNTDGAVTQAVAKALKDAIDSNTTALGLKLAKASNLSDLANSATALQNLGAAYNKDTAKAANFTIMLADRGQVLQVTTGASNLTATLDSSTLVNGFMCLIRKSDSGAGSVSTSPATQKLGIQGHTILIWSDGTYYYTRAFYGAFDASGNLTISSAGDINLTPTGDVKISSGNVMAKAIKATGSAGAGYLEIPDQSVNPAASNGFSRFFSNSSSRFSFVKRNLANTADILRSWVFPDSDTTITYPRTGTVAMNDSLDVYVTTKVSLTSAQILTLFSNPVTLLPAPGAGKMYNILNMLAALNYGTAAYTTNVNLCILFGTSLGAPVGQNSFILTSSITRFQEIQKSTPNSASIKQYVPNDTIVAQVLNGNPVAGNGTLDIYITYKIITV